MCRSLLPLLVSCLLVATTLPGAVAANPAVDARYNVQSMGVDVGSAALQLEKGAEGLATRFQFGTAALLGLVEETDTRMETLAAGAGNALGLKRFVGIYKKEDRTREIDIGYSADGAIDAFELKKRGSVRVATVPEGLAAGTVDPLAAFLRARAWLDQASVGSDLTLSVFDGRKHYDTNLRYLGLTQVAGEHGSAPAHRVAIHYELVEALNEDSGVLESERQVRPRELEMTVSADGRYVPLTVDGNLDGMPITAVLAGDCAGPGGCAD